MIVLKNKMTLDEIKQAESEVLKQILKKVGTAGVFSVIKKMR